MAIRVRSLRAVVGACLTAALTSTTVAVHAAPAATDAARHQHMLIAPGGDAGDGFGYAVAISNGVIVVGAPRRTVNGNKDQGVAYVFVKPASGWGHATVTTVLRAPSGQAGDEFGASVAVAGDTIAVGAPLATAGSDTNEGAVYVFTAPGGGWSSVHHPAGRLVPSDQAAYDLFGSSLAARGNTIVVGSPDHIVGQHYEQGAAYVYVRPSTGWASQTHETRELTAAHGRAFGRLGSSVALSGGTVVAGTPFDTVGSKAAQGSATVFAQPSGGGWGRAAEVATLTARAGAAGDHFGAAVAVSGPTVAVGAPNHTVDGNRDQGLTYVFNRPGGGWRSAQQDAVLKVVPGVKAAYFGWGVAAGSDRIVGYGYGTESVFTRPTGGWVGTHHQRLQLVGAAANGQLSRAIAMAGSTIVAGAPSQTVGGDTAQGAVYVFVG